MSVRFETLCFTQGSGTRSYCWLKNDRIVLDSVMLSPIIFSRQYGS